MARARGKPAGASGPAVTAAATPPRNPRRVVRRIGSLRLGALSWAKQVGRIIEKGRNIGQGRPQGRSRVVRGWSCAIRDTRAGLGGVAGFVRRRRYPGTRWLRSGTGRVGFLSDPTVTGCHW